MRSLLLAVCTLGCITSCFGQDPGTYKLTLGFNYYDQPRKHPFFQSTESEPTKLQFWFLSSLNLRVQSGLLVSLNPFPPAHGVSGRGDTLVGGTLVLTISTKAHPLRTRLPDQTSHGN